MSLSSPSSPPTPPTGRGLAVLVGIDAYGQGIAPLRNAVRDVRSIAQLLADEHGYTTQLIFDSDATLAGLRAMLAGLGRQVSAETRLVLYFAGHGIAEETEQATDGPRGFLIPQDAKHDVPATFLPMAEVQAALAKLPCKHLLLFLDCCFAGAFRWSSTRSIGVRRKTLYRERYERYLRDSARQVITSASADEYALDTIAGGKLGRRVEETENSPFAAALCQGLRGSADLRVDDQPGDGVILSSELHLYLEAQFNRLEQKLGRSLQKPLLWALDGHDKGQFFFFTPGRPLALPSALTLNEDNNPYRGLLPYEAKHAKEFFGREPVIDALQAQVLASPFVLVSGVSGSGKSSVVRAGLMPRLAALPEWKVLDIVRPGQRPLSELSAVLGSLGASRDAALSAASGAWQAQNPGRRLLLVIDQLEELVTLGASAAERIEFLQRIREAVTASAGLLHVVFTLRSDFEPHFSDLLATRDSGVTRFLVTPPDRQALRQIIEGPASERVLFFEPATLIDRLIDEVADMPGALPLLSFTLSELYRAYLRSGRDDRSLRVEDYEKLGGVAGSLSQRADEIFNALDSEHQQTLRRLMLRMVALQAGEVARRRVPKSELDYGKNHPEQPRIDALCKQLEDARLLVSGRDSNGTAYVEPAHDKLVLGWPRLWTFLKEDQETIPLHRLLTQEAETWEQRKRDHEHLWAHNPRLPLALAALKDQPLRWNARETAFIEESERRRKRQQNITRALVAATLAVFAGLTGVALYQWRQAVAQTTLAQKRLNDAVQVAEQIVSVVDEKLDHLAGASAIRGELLPLGRKLLSDLGPATQTHRDARRTESMTLTHQADLLTTHGGPEALAEAKRLYEQALAISQEHLNANPRDKEAQRDLSISLDRLGDVAVKLGQLAEAKTSYERALKIRETLAAADQNQANPQRDRSISLIKLGDVAEQMGQLAEAKAYFERSLQIHHSLTTAGVKNLEDTRNLSSLLMRLGTVAERMGELSVAKVRLEHSLKIAEIFAAADKNDLRAQRNLSISLDRLGRVAEQLGQLAEAKAYFGRSLKISETIAAADETDAEAQRNLSVDLHRLGRVAERLGQLAEAKAYFERTLKIFETLTAADKNDVQAQSNLAASLGSLGDVVEQLGQLAEAKAYFERSLKIFETLAAADKNDAQAQRNVSISLNKLGEVARKMGQLAEAKAYFERCLKISETLAAADKTDARAQRNLSISLETLGSLADTMDQLAEAKAYFERSLQISETLAAADKNDVQAQSSLSSGLERVATVSRHLGLLDIALSYQRRALDISQQMAQRAPSSVELQRKLLFHRMQMAFIHRQRKDRAAVQQEAKAAAKLLGTWRTRLPKQEAEEYGNAIRSLLR